MVTLTSPEIQRRRAGVLCAAGDAGARLGRRRPHHAAAAAAAAHVVVQLHVGGHNLHCRGVLANWLTLGADL